MLCAASTEIMIDTYDNGECYTEDVCFFLLYCVRNSLFLKLPDSSDINENIYIILVYEIKCDLVLLNIIKPSSQLWVTLVECVYQC